MLNRKCHSQARRLGGIFGIVCAASLLCGCGGGGDAAPEVPRYPVSGTMQGLTVGMSLVLQTSWGESLTLQGDGTFAFKEMRPGGSTYAIRIASAPADMQCSVPIDGSGAMPSAAVDTLRVRCVIPGGLPSGDWEQGTCQPARWASDWHMSYRNMVYLARPETFANNFGYVGYFASTAYYANADCTGKRWVHGAGKPLATGFGTSRTQQTSSRSVYWGETNSVGLASPFTFAKIWVRQENYLCIFEEMKVSDFPDAASLDNVIADAIARHQCYTPV